MTSRDRLATLLEIPEQVAAVGRREVPGLLAELEGLRVQLWARLLAEESVAPVDARRPDRLLTPTETAAVLGVRVRWIYRHHHQLPFTRRMSRKRLRFSESGLQAWIADQHGRRRYDLSKMEG
jgi:predicted DNA-binding transcriptional regulator AlpA